MKNESRLRSLLTNLLLLLLIAATLTESAPHQVLMGCRDWLLPILKTLTHLLPS